MASLSSDACDKKMSCLFLVRGVLRDALVAAVVQERPYYGRCEERRRQLVACKLWPPMLA